jgi:hypothetical protein
LAESASQTSGPSLEQILWRAMDRFEEKPALVDAEEFADHIAQAFDADIAEESFAEHFFGDADKLHRPRKTAAEAVVQAARQRLHAYEFDLDRLEYVIVEDRDQLVVVSEFGQFALRNDDAVGRALEAAVVRKPERGGGEPRGYFVRKNGEVVGVDVSKVARTIERLRLAQVSAPAVDAPAGRLAPFNPVRRALTASREERVLRQEPRMARPLPPSPTPAGSEAKEPALLILMPDGSLARPSIGAASRWQQMLGRHAQSSPRQFAVESGNVVAVVSGAQRSSAGDRAQARSEALAAVRSETAPVRTLGDDRLAQAFNEGARLLPATVSGDRFWVQPGQAFQPERLEKPVAAEPLQLGQITGDPWADWALAMGGARLRQWAQRAPQAEEDLAPVRAGRPAPLQLAGAQVIAFRAPDGTVVLNGPATPIRLAASGRPEAPAALRQRAEMAPRAGAVPFAALQALQLSLERTAAAGGYRLPLARLESTPDAIETGHALRLDPADDRRGSARLLGPSTLAGRTAQLVLSMPFPNASEIHVGSDLSEALQAYLGAPVLPVLPSVPATPEGPGQIAFRLRRVEGEGTPQQPGFALELPDTHLRAQRTAADAVLTLDVPGVRPLLGGDPAISSLPLLLRRAMAEGGDWTPGPGAGLPLAVQDLAERAPFAVPQIEVAVPAPVRPASPGVEEIVVPLPLWAQMGRGALAETGRIMASPLSPAGHVPPLGVYRLVVPGGGRLDLTGGAPAHWPGSVDLSGPTALRLDRRASGSVSATNAGGAHLLGRVPVDDGRRRHRVGAPIKGPAAAPPPQVLVEATEPAAVSPPAAAPFGGEASAAPVSRPDSIAAGVRPPSPAFRASASAAVPPAKSPAPRPLLSRPASLPGVPPQPALASAAAIPSLVAPRVQAQPVRRAPVAAGTVSPVVVPRSPSGEPRAQGRQMDVTGPVVAPTPTAAVPVFAASGLPPGMWSGHRPHEDAGYRRWVYSASYRDQPQAVGGLQISALSRPRYPQLPSALRFRYVAAPLWWSGNVRAESGAEETDSQAAQALRSGLRAANSAAAIWRSILVAGASQDDATGGMDAGREESAESMGGPARSFEPLFASTATPAPAAAAAAPAYIVMSASGAAGAVSGTAASRSRAQAVEMSIVAAIPPAPPPLESMSSAPRGGDAPHARGRAPAQHAAHGQHKEAEDAVSHSKIEGSVDAIAQRIYHRIRQRIQSDRERFGG